jgi:hypothetical protein
MEVIKSVFTLPLLIITLTLFSFNSLNAQVKEAERLRIQNNDLGEKKGLFEVKSHHKKQESFALLLSGNNQYMLDVASGKKFMKVSNDFAQKADGEFVKKFIEFKYGMKKRKEKKCESVFTLSMRGEEQEICQDEETKIAQVLGIIKNLKKELSIK